jgi:hypothetical protein
MRSWFVGMLLGSLACATSGSGERAAPAGESSAVAAVAPAARANVPRVVRGNLTTELVPELGPEAQARLSRYLDVRRADIAGWDAGGTGLFVLTRLANVPQLHRVDTPLGMRRQLTFGSEGVDGFVASPNPASGAGILIADVGGSEDSQLYLLDARGEQRLISDGKSRNEAPVWAADGSRVAFSSTRRNARDFDLWVYDVTHPEAPPTLAYEASGQWKPLDWAPAGDALLVSHFISETKSELAVVVPGRGVVHEFRVAEPAVDVAFDGGVFGPDGKGVYYLSDHGGEHRALWAGRSCRSTTSRRSAFAPSPSCHPR